MSSAIRLNLDQSKILSSGNGLILYWNRRRMKRELIVILHFSYIKWTYLGYKLHKYGDEIKHSEYFADISLSLHLKSCDPFKHQLNVYNLHITILDSAKLKALPKE